jgi:hypothetical protein
MKSLDSLESALEQSKNLNEQVFPQMVEERAFFASRSNWMFSKFSTGSTCQSPEQLQLNECKSSLSELFQSISKKSDLLQKALSKAQEDLETGKPSLWDYERNNFLKSCANGACRDDLLAVLSMIKGDFWTDKF